MIAGKTSSEFSFEISEAALDDWELLEILSDIDDGKTQKLGAAIKLLLGDEQAKALKEHCRNDEGRVPTSAMMKEIGDIFAALKENRATKN